MDDGPTLSLFVESWDLFRDAALAGAFAGALLGFLGVYVVLRRMVFVSAALSQSSALGVTIAFWAHAHLGVSGLLASPVVFAAALTFGVALLLMTDTSAQGARRESLLGLAYLVGSAGALAIGTRVIEEHHEIEELLFGSAVAVLPEDFRMLSATVFLLFALHLWWRRGFVQASFDRDGARVRGLPVRTLELTLLASLALSISVSTHVLGALPVFAFSVLPAMAAVRVCVNVPRALATAALLGGLAGLLGYVAAFLYELPVGAAQSLTAATFVAGAEVARRILLVARR
jgi:zinc transport system permease protein